MEITSNKNQLNYIKSIIKFSKKFDKKGFITNKNFMIEKGLFMPGTLAYNFNPLRETIIKSITNNVRKVIKFLVKNNLNYEKH